MNLHNCNLLVWLESSNNGKESGSIITLAMFSLHSISRIRVQGVRGGVAMKNSNYRETKVPIFHSSRRLWHQRNFERRKLSGLAEWFPSWQRFDFCVRDFRLRTRKTRSPSRTSQNIGWTPTLSLLKFTCVILVIDAYIFWKAPPITVLFQLIFQLFLKFQISFHTSIERARPNPPRLERQILFSSFPWLDCPLVILIFVTNSAIQTQL